MTNLILLQYRIFRNRILRLDFFDDVKISVILLIGLGFLSFIYFGSFRLLAYLNSVQIAGPLLVNKFLALIFLSSFFMVAFSSVVTSFTTIFTSKDITWLMTTPLSVKKIFAFKSTANFINSSWMVFIALFPVLLALGRVKHTGIFYYFLVILLLLPFLFLASLLGQTINLFLMRFLPQRQVRDYFVLLAIIIITALYVLFRLFEPERFVKPDGLAVIAQYLSYLDAPTAVYLPSWWVAAGIFSIIAKNTTNLLFYFMLLYGSVTFVLIALIGFAKKLYFVGWAEGQILAKQKSLKKHSYDILSPLYTLIKKDFIIFFRDISQWSQILILCSIIFVYLFSIYKLPLDTMDLQNLVSYANIALIGFILSAVALRLIFPSISIEGDSAWLLFASPLSRPKLFWSKLIFGSIPVIALAMILILASNYLLKTDNFIFCVTSVSTIIMAVGLSTLAMSFGTVFPRFDLSNIVEIEASFGGLMYIISAFFYVALNMTLLSIPIQNHYHVKFGMTQIPWSFLWRIGIGFIVLNMIVYILPVYIGLKKLRRIEK
ncbi:MAG: hypothetical protein LHV68_04690 [Elusimicrobia bacterium]|nr:hypothetical protein [Candidatus Liberimonas magnetica]